MRFNKRGLHPWPYPEFYYLCVMRGVRFQVSNVTCLEYVKCDEGCSFSTVKCYMSEIPNVINLNVWKNPIESFLVKNLMSEFSRPHPVICEDQSCFLYDTN